MLVPAKSSIAKFDKSLFFNKFHFFFCHDALPAAANLRTYAYIGCQTVPFFSFLPIRTMTVYCILFFSLNIYTEMDVWVQFRYVTFPYLFPFKLCTSLYHIYNYVHIFTHRFSFFISRYYQRRRNNGDQRCNCVWLGYDVLGERTARGAITMHDDAVSLSLIHKHTRAHIYVCI